MLGVQGLTRSDPRRFALGVLNAALGGGTSSRLFQEVREKRGLAYSVFSFASQHVDAGLVGVSVGCLPNKLEQVLDVVRAELAKIAQDGIDAEELTRGKGQLKGGLVLGLEDSASRMTRLGKSELVDDELLSIDEVLARIDAVTLDDVRTLAAELFSPAGDPGGRRSPLTRSPVTARRSAAGEHVHQPVEARHLLRAVEGPQHLLLARLVRHRHPHLEPDVLERRKARACPAASR